MTNLNTNDSTKEIIVEIEKIQNATIIEGDNFFEAELKLAIELINYILNHLNMDDKEKNRDKENNWFHQHNTIAVLGPRGAGKTSFILTLRDIIENYNNNKKDKKFEEKYKNCKELGKKIIWLPNLDPTRMEENETFLATVVANILKTIKKNNDLDFNIREGLQLLSRDFSVLVSARVHEEQWKDLVDDPDSFAYNVLSNAHSGISLARSFHEFLGTCIKTLGKNEKDTVFVQPIDDIDTAIEQGWPILETIRKYLATPHLIIIVTGDIDLYETLVRKRQLDKLSHLLENESTMGGNVRKIGDQIAQLTEQYLSKVIPSHLRIRLKPIAHYINQTKLDDFVYLKFDENKKQQLSIIYDNFVRDLFGPNYGDVMALDHRSSTARLFPSITRDLVRFFKALKPWYDAYNVYDVKIKRQEGEIDDEIKRTLDTLIQIFNAALYNHNITPHDLLLLNEGRHLEWLGNYCLNVRQEIQEFWRLFPRYDDEEWNCCALLLNAFLYQSWKAKYNSGSPEEQIYYYPHRPMSYGIKVLLPCLLADSRDLTGEKLSEMKRFLDIGNTERHFWMAIRSLAYRLQDSAQNWSKYGSGYVIVNDPDPAKWKKFPINWENPSAWFCHFMYRPNSGKALYADILIALARLVDVLREGLGCDNTQLENIFNLFIQDRVWYLHSLPQSESNINGGFQASGELTLSGLTMRPEPGKVNYKLDGRLESKSGHITDHNVLISKDDQSNIITTPMMEKWIEEMSRLCPEKILPPPIIARIWRRFIDNLEYIRSDIGVAINKKNISLNDVLTCWIKAFLNACLIEEVIFRKGPKNSTISMQNIRYPSYPKDVFDTNYDNSHNNKSQDTISYTEAWRKCPLFLRFLEAPKKFSGSR